MVRVGPDRLGPERLGRPGDGIPRLSGHAGKRWLGGNLARDPGPFVADAQAMGLVCGLGNTLKTAPPRSAGWQHPAKSRASCFYDWAVVSGKNVGKDHNQPPSC